MSRTFSDLFPPERLEALETVASDLGQIVKMGRPFSAQMAPNAAERKVWEALQQSSKSLARLAKAVKAAQDRQK